MRTNRQPVIGPSGYSLPGKACSPYGPMRARACIAGCSLALILAVLGPDTARSQTLNEALASAFSGNPGLDAERARQRADEETVRQAWARGLPNLSLDAFRGAERTRVEPSISTTNLDPEGYSLTLTQPLFQGFRIYNGTRRAKAQVRAGAAQLHNREQNILLEAVTAYMNVVQDRRIARLRNSNIRFLRNELSATKARFKAGDLSRTDVAQATSRLFEGEADFAQAQATAEASQASYEAIVGRRPGALGAPRVPDELLPPTLEAALRIAESTNPAIISALHSQEAARRAKREAYGALLPTVSLELRQSVDRNSSKSFDQEDQSSVFVRMNMPLYQGGEVRSRIRQTRASETGASYQVSDSRRRTRASVIDAWKQVYAARVRIMSAKQQVKAARDALKGVQVEVKVGERALFEVLDAQRELVNGQVAQARAQRDHVVSSYTLLAATGRLTAAYLSLPVAYPDLDDAVRRKNPKALFEESGEAVAPARAHWRTSADETRPVKRYRLSSAVKPARGKARPPARQAPNPLLSLRTSYPAD